MIQHSTFWGSFIFYGKIVGSASAFVTVASFVYTKVVSPVVKKVIHINETVTTLAENHLPHIQASLNAQDVVLQEVKKEVSVAQDTISKYGENLNDTRFAVGELHSAFINHLENVSRETVRKRRNAIRVDGTARVSPRPSRNSR